MSDVESLSYPAKPRRRWYAYALLLVLIAVAGAAITVVFVRPPRFVRNWPGVKLGMSKDEVVGLLGRPTEESRIAMVNSDGTSPMAIEYWTWERKFGLPSLFGPSEESFVIYFDWQGRVRRCRPPIAGPYASLYKEQGNAE
jgi:hypothetical protein